MTGVHAPTASAIRLYPNPSRGSFQLDLGQPYQQIELVVLDLSGRELVKRRYQGQTRLAPSFDLPAGTYVLRLNLDGKVEYLRWVAR